MAKLKRELLESTNFSAQTILAKIKPTTERDCYTLDEFCRRHAISRGTYYNLKAAGKGPVEMRAMGRVLISREAAEAWRRAREVESENA